VIRCTLAHVDLAALQANFQAIAGFLASGPRAGDARPGAPSIIAVVKANAYGHGAGPVGIALERAGARMLACADIEEGIVLRQAGVRAAILVFGALSVSDLTGVFDYGLTPTISTPSAGRALEAAAAQRGRRARYHLKIDTGMNRLGFRHDNLARTVVPLLSSPHLELEAIYTHFGTADDPGHPLFSRQRERFRAVLADLGRAGARPQYVHAANSAALLRDPGVWFDAVRPGLLLYGVVPPPLSPPIPLKPVMSLRSRIVSVKGVRTGEAVGYGARFVAGRPTTIATVPAGYADGLDARLAGRGSVLVRGRRAPIVGAVCMDMIMIDVTGIPVEPGDPVVILGADRSDEITAAEMAATIDTIPYEVLCRIGSRIERVYNSDESDEPVISPGSGAV
jgi:alanine racemase